ncbi:hypothetical protein Ancab_003711 [Ancistrocladus abbreviatus]
MGRIIITNQQQGIYTFPNGFARSTLNQQDQQQPPHSQQQQQIRRDKLRVQGFEFEPTGPQPLVGIDPGDDSAGTLHAYETAGMLSEMFNFGPGPGPGSASELFEHQIPSSGFNRNPSLWYGGRQGSTGGRQSLGQQQQQPQISVMNADSAAAMQLFLANPPPRSPSPPPPTPAAASTSTLHLLLPNPSGFHSMGSASSTNLGGFTNSVMTQQPPFTWVPDTSAHDHSGTPGPEIGSIVEGQGLSLSLSSSLQHLETAKAEELRIDIGGDGGLMFFSQAGGGGGASSSTNSGHHYLFKNLGAGGAHHHPHQNNHHQVHIGFGSSLGVVNVLRNSKYARPALELLEEFCSVGRGHFSKTKFGKNNSSSTPPGATGTTHNGGGGAAAASSSASKDPPPLSAADRMEHQRRKVKLLSMLDEACLSLYLYL